MSTSTETLIAQSRAFVAQVFTSEVNKSIESLSSLATKAETTLSKMAELVYANGGRVEHFQASENESPLDKALRLEMVREWESHFVVNFTPTQKKALGYDKKEVPAEMKIERAKAQRKMGTYRGRFLDHLNAIQNPKTESPADAPAESEGESAPAKSEKGDKDRILESLMSARKYAQRIEDADFNIPQVVALIEATLAEIMGEKAVAELIESEDE